MSTIEQYILDNKGRFLQELFSLISIPSISSEAAHKKDMIKAAENIGDLIKSAGADIVAIHETEGNPIVYAEKNINPNSKTILIYGHYDVMPVEPINEWNTEPFKPVIRNGHVYGRGADDDKGQLFIQIKAFEYLNKTGRLNCNVKFMIEGEEEIGSSSISTWCKNHKDLLKADIILVSDTSMIDEEIPSITCGLRGLLYFDIDVFGPNRDLHSGLYGGAVTNPVNALSTMISKLTDHNGRILIPGFYDDVKEFSASERNAINSAPFSEDKFKKSIGIEETNGEKGYTTMERKGIRPTLDICGIWGGYTGEGSKTIIPSSAHAKISMRLVANQNLEKISDSFIKYFKSIAPEGTKVDIQMLHGGIPYMTDTNSQAYTSIHKAVKDVFGTEPVPFYSGGSIPIISTFEKELGLKSILIGFGLDTDAIHAPNENFKTSMFEKGFRTIITFYKYFSEAK